jgi:hypothetical protein
MAGSSSVFACIRILSTGWRPSSGPSGEAWYRIYDDLTGFPYHINPLHVRPIREEELAPINPEVPVQDKRIEVDLTMQTLTAIENDKKLLKTTISSGIPNSSRNVTGLSTKTPQGEFRILDKMPAKHMGNGNLFADADDYELPGVPWTLYLRRGMPSMAPTGTRTSARR